MLKNIKLSLIVISIIGISIFIFYMNKKELTNDEAVLLAIEYVKKHDNADLKTEEYKISIDKSEKLWQVKFYKTPLVYFSFIIDPEKEVVVERILGD